MDIFEAVECDVRTGVKYLEACLKDGTDVNVRNAVGDTLLYKAVHSLGEHKLEVLKYLISKGADANAKDKQGYTALFWAATNASVSFAGKAEFEVLEYLISVSADIPDIDTFPTLPNPNSKKAVSMLRKADAARAFGGAWYIYILMALAIAAALALFIAINDVGVGSAIIVAAISVFLFSRANNMSNSSTRRIVWIVLGFLAFLFISPPLFTSIAGIAFLLSSYAVYIMAIVNDHVSARRIEAKHSKTALREGKEIT